MKGLGGGNIKPQVMSKQSVITGRSMSSQPLSNGYLGKDFPPHLLLNTALYNMGYLFRQFRSALDPSQPPVHPHLLTGAAEGEPEKVLTLGRAVQQQLKHGWIYQHHFGHWFQMLHQLLPRKLTLPQPNLVHSLHTRVQLTPNSEDTLNEK